MDGFFLFQERLRKLENERTGLHMEISVLSEQVDAQSSKIIELENMLQEKKDTLRHMEEALQKVKIKKNKIKNIKTKLVILFFRKYFPGVPWRHKSLSF